MEVEQTILKPGTPILNMNFSKSSLNHLATVPEFCSPEKLTLDVKEGCWCRSQQCCRERDQVACGSWGGCVYVCIFNGDSSLCCLLPHLFPFFITLVPLFKKFHLSECKERKKRQREQLQSLEIVRGLKPGARNSIHVSHVGGRGPSFWALSRSKLARNCFKTQLWNEMICICKF